MSAAVTITAPAPWTARPVPCRLAESALVCITGEVGRAVPVVVRGARPDVERVVRRLRGLGYRCVSVEAIREAR